MIGSSFCRMNAVSITVGKIPKSVGGSRPECPGNSLRRSFRDKESGLSQTLALCVAIGLETLSNARAEYMVVEYIVEVKRCQ